MDNQTKPRPRPRPETTTVHTGGASYGIAMAWAYFAIGLLIGLISFFFA